MSNKKHLIDGTDFTNMVLSGGKTLQSQVQVVNDLNVFPVPDGDTGTNMNLTLTSGMNMLQSKPNAHIGQAAEQFAKGLLMGARGNSGVILSQLFRGMAKAAADLKKMGSTEFAAALQQGVDTAYQAVVKPVEGTILTVSRESAEHAVTTARSTTDLVELMEAVLHKAKETLIQTPELLPVLKQAGVVDSGGQGLVFIYEGFLAWLKGEVADVEVSVPANHTVQSESVTAPASQVAQAHFESEDIEFPYDMEFFITKYDPQASFNLDDFRHELAKNGDSILVIPDDEIIKVHVHTNAPGDVLNLSLQHGELSKFHIENMREQHKAIVEDPRTGNFSAVVEETPEVKRYGVVAIAVGAGMADIFTSLGVDYVLSGGQTMNPSTEDIVAAIENIHAEHVFVLPNNSNIILAAQQARDLLEKPVTVLASKTIPQGLAAMFAFQTEGELERNIEAMEQAISDVKSGQVTYAVRDSQVDDLAISKGDFLGVYDSSIVTTEKSVVDASSSLLRKMVSEDDEILTIITGEDAAQEHIDVVVSFAEEQFPDLEVEVHAGGQPLYTFIFALE